MDSPSMASVKPSVESMIPTLRFMVHRKLRRKAHGEYKRHSSRRYIFSALVIALFMTLVGVGAQRLEVATTWPELALVVLLLLVMVYIVVKVSIVVRWLVLATLVLFVINRGSLFDQLKSTAPPDEKFLQKAKIVIIVLVLLEAMTLGIVFFIRVAYPRIVLRATWLNSRKWWRIKDIPSPESKSVNYQTVVFSYVSWDPDEYRLQRSSVSYVGEFDDQGRPHGLGEWTDHTFTGEALQGIWEHGIPIGPFKSQEYGTGNSFSNIRIGFCKNSVDTNDSTKFSTARDPKGLSYGAAGVECSVSGKFFHHLPHVRVLAPNVLRSELEKRAKDDPESASIPMAYPLSFLSTFAESLQSRPAIRGSFRGLSSPRSAPLSKSIVVRYTDRGVFIPGYVRRRRTDVNEVTIRRVCPPNLGVEGQHLNEVDTAGPRTNATVPALNLPDGADGASSTGATSDEDGDSDSGTTRRLAVQDAPHAGPDGRISPKEQRKRLDQAGLMVDGWRQVLDMGSSTLTNSRAGYEALVFVNGYNCALTYGIARLGQLLSLGEFPAYIKPFIFSWPSSTTMGYYNAKKVGCSDAVAQDLQQFIKDLREAGFRRVHILAHSMGARVVLAALRKGYFDGVFAERDVVEVESSIISHAESNSPLRARKTVHYRDSMPLPRRSPQAVGNSSNSLENDDASALIQLATFTLLNPDADLDIFLEEDYWKLSQFCPHVTLYADAHDGALFWSELLGRKSSLGRQPHTLIYEPTQEILDMDVVDTTSLDTNIHSLRHQFFTLNRMLVDDLYDIIVLGHRAREREARLSSRWTFSDDGVQNGSVYTFLCAPSYVVNK
ncbi:hypothetical protein BGZ83_003424 [Gryganskiella cystojenkinii]|nr:hypothetical protein BGZ83_003424 [Gryganskiella cystojenkinii]